MTRNLAVMGIATLLILALGLTLYLVLNGSIEPQGESPQYPAKVGHEGVPSAEPSIEYVEADRGKKEEQARRRRGGTEPILATVTGRVVDEVRRPVGGVEVQLWIPYGDEFRSMTDDDGRFVIEGVPRQARGRDGSVVALDRAGGRAGVNAMRLESGAPQALRPWLEKVAPPASEIDVDVVVLGPAWPVAVAVREDGIPLAGAGVTVETTIDRVFSGTARAGSDGEVIFLLPEGAVFARASMPPLSGSAAGAAAPPESRLVIALGPSVGVEVLVVEPGTREPIAGATVEALERLGARGSLRRFDLDVPVTDGSGRTRIVGLPHGATVVLTASKRGYTTAKDPSGMQPARAELPEGADFVTLELVPQETRTVTVPLVAGEAAIPPDGTRLVLREAPGRFEAPSVIPPPGGRVEGATIVVEQVPAGGYFAWAETPDDLEAVVWVEPEETVGRETSFRPMRRVVVTVRRANGDPVEGALVSAHSRGGNLLVDPVSTSADGRASLERLHCVLADVRVLPPAGKSALSVGTVDLEGGDEELEVVLPPVGRLDLQCFIDGTPRLPAKFAISTNPGWATIVSEDPESGICRIEATAQTGSEEIHGLVMANGFVPAEFRAPVEWLGTDAVIPVKLERTGRLIVSVVRPLDLRVRLKLEEWSSIDGADGRWGPPRSLVRDEAGHPNGPDGTFVFDRLPRGRYRVTNRENGMATEGVDLDPSVGDAHLELDLGVMVRIAGRVETPEETDLSLVRVVARGERTDLGVSASSAPADIEPALVGGIGLDDEGRFTATVPADRDVELRPWHPYLEPAEAGGVAVIRNGEPRSVVLRLEPGNELLFPVPEDLENRSLLNVYLYDAEPEGDPVARLQGQIVDGVARVGGYAAGEYTVCVDTKGIYAPLIVQGLKLGEGEAWLTLPAFELGSSLRVEIRGSPRRPTPPLWVCGQAVTGPVYCRSKRSDTGANEIIVSGFGRGVFRVGVVPQIPGYPTLDRIVEFDGASDEGIVYEVE